MTVPAAVVGISAAAMRAWVRRVSQAASMARSRSSVAAHPRPIWRVRTTRSHGR